MIIDERLISWHGPTSTHGGKEYAGLIVELRRFLDSLAGAKPDAATIVEISSTLDRLTSRLDALAVEENEQVYGRRADLIGRGQATWPPVNYTAGDDIYLEGTVRFGRYFLGRNGVIHGGAVLFLFDEVAGRLANLGGRPVARTAYVRTDFRAPAPIDTDLIVTARLIREEGRKRFVRLELHDGARLCTEAEVLMVMLLPGQK